MEKVKKVRILSRRGYFYLHDADTDERLKGCHGSEADGGFETREAAVESAKYHGYEIID
jgi:hypothetical protein